MTRKPTNLKASIAARLRNIAAAKQTNLELVLRRYAIERLLYRLSISAHRDHFVLKGAMLFTAWVPDPFRPTQDLDLLGFGEADEASLTQTFRSICAEAVPDDGIVFDTDRITVEPIREQQEYGGARLRLTAMLANIRIPVHIDIGFGDAITPAAVDLEFPPLLDAPAPQVRAYPKETVIAEKFHAIVALGAVNTRMKDYYDLLALARLFDFDGESVSAAIVATFARRATPLPSAVPPGLRASFAADPQKLQLWHAFTHRESLMFDTGDLAAVIKEIEKFVMPPVEAVRRGATFTRKWRAGGSWRNHPRRVRRAQREE